MFPNGNVGLENSKFYEDVPARGHLIGRAAKRLRQRQKVPGGVLQIQKKPRRRYLPGLLPHEYEAWATPEPSHRNTTTQEDAYK